MFRKYTIFVLMKPREVLVDPLNPSEKILKSHMTKMKIVGYVVP